MMMIVKMTDMIKIVTMMLILADNAYNTYVYETFL